MCLRGFPGPSLYLATTPQGRGEDDEGKERQTAEGEDGNTKGRRTVRRHTGDKKKEGEGARDGEVKENNKQRWGGHVTQHFY